LMRRLSVCDRTNRANTLNSSMAASQGALSDAWRGMGGAPGRGDRSRRGYRRVDSARFPDAVHRTLTDHPRRQSPPRRSSFGPARVRGPRSPERAFQQEG
jgi:hypothetical protein